MTPEQFLRFVEAKEVGKMSATRLFLPHATEAIAGSMYVSDVAEEPPLND